MVPAHWDPDISCHFKISLKIKCKHPTCVHALHVRGETVKKQTVSVHREANFLLIEPQAFCFVRRFQTKWSRIPADLLGWQEGRSLAGPGRSQQPRLRNPLSLTLLTERAASHYPLINPCPLSLYFFPYILSFITLISRFFIFSHVLLFPTFSTPFPSRSPPPSSSWVQVKHLKV